MGSDLMKVRYGVFREISATIMPVRKTKSCIEEEEAEEEEERNIEMSDFLASISPKGFIFSVHSLWFLPSDALRVLTTKHSHSKTSVSTG